MKFSTTIIALVAYLRQAAIIACGIRRSLPTVWPKAARSAILARRLERKWFITDVTITMKQLPIDGLYYLANSPGLDPDELDHHENCVKERCLYQYDHSMYVTKHTTIPWQKQCCRSRPVYGGQLGPERGQKGWEDAMARILMKADEDGNPAAVPIALWVKGSRTLGQWNIILRAPGSRTMWLFLIALGHLLGCPLPEFWLDIHKLWRDHLDLPWHHISNHSS
jgi:hypothetical protein